jgi:hypothetical protein
MGSIDHLCGLVGSSWLQIQRSWVRFLAQPDFLSSGLKRGSLSHVGKIEEILGRKISDFGLEN